MLLSVSDIRSLGQASRLVASVAERDRERIASHRTRLDALKNAREALRTQAHELDTLRAGAERARLAADRAVTTRNALVASIDSARDLNAQFAGELQAAQQKLQNTIRGIGGAAPADATLPLRPFRGDLEWPVAGSVRQAFGRGRPASNGIEIAAAEGAPVKVVHDGTVAFANVFTGFGKLVIVDHGAQTFSLYGNLLEIAVTSGAHVAQGDLLGTAGPALAAGLPAGANGRAGLYFELRIDAHPVDPLQWLKRK
jgi:septal ring factor EnvC (AmiA/AmiB activator)